MSLSCLVAASDNKCTLLHLDGTAGRSLHLLALLGSCVLLVVLPSVKPYLRKPEKTTCTSSRCMLDLIPFFSDLFWGWRISYYKDAMKETTSVHEGHPQ